MTDMDLSHLELHDARLLAVHWDLNARTADIVVEYFREPQARDRVPGTLRFHGVSQLHQIADLDLLAEHAGSGNVVGWASGERAGVTHIQLARGLISVTAASVELVGQAR